MDAIDIGPTITRIMASRTLLFSLKPCHRITRITATFSRKQRKFPPVNLISVRVPPRVALSDLNHFASPMLAALSNMPPNNTIHLTEFVGTDVATSKCIEWCTSELLMYTDVSSESLAASLTHVVFWYPNSTIVRQWPHRGIVNNTKTPNAILPDHDRQCKLSTKCTNVNKYEVKIVCGWPHP